jgi:hypothetical protein
MEKALLMIMVSKNLKEMKKITINKRTKTLLLYRKV